MAYYLAVDIGASSGRHILGEVKGGKLLLEEVYRFENGMESTPHGLIWDVDRLFAEVVAGMEKCREIGKIPSTVAIDTWGVDYVLLDGAGEAIKPVMAYRDPRTLSVIDEVERIVLREELYSRTGIQRQTFNTVYQLYCDKKSGKLEGAHRMLMIPEYLTYRLTGVMMSEYTNATTTSLVNAAQGTWDLEIADRLGIKREIFGSLHMPSTRVGALRDEVRKLVGYDTDVVLCASHDTASAVAACPIGEGAMYISSGTWSLAGVECAEPITAPCADAAGFTNEGGVDRNFRFLKNIMGMWLFQNIRKDTGKKYSYDEMMKMAQESTFGGRVDVNSPEFTAPECMTDAIRRKLGAPDLPLGDVLACVYHSLAGLYRDTLEELERITGKDIREIHIVGGGGADGYLNRLTAQMTGRAVYTGLKEATAAGNLLCQLRCTEPSMTLADCRSLIKRSFALHKTV